MFPSCHTSPHLPIHRFLLLLLIACLALVVVGCQKGDAPAEATSAPAPAKNVKVAEVSERMFADEIDALGTVRAMEAITISTTVTERVVEAAFEDGDWVKKGELLVRLEDAEEMASLAAA